MRKTLLIGILSLTVFLMVSCNGNTKKSEVDSTIDISSEVSSTEIVSSEPVSSKESASSKEVSSKEPVSSKVTSSKGTSSSKVTSSKVTSSKPEEKKEFPKATLEKTLSYDFFDWSGKSDAGKLAIAVEIKRVWNAYPKFVKASIRKLSPTEILKGIEEQLEIDSEQVVMFKSACVHFKVDLTKFYKLLEN